MGSGWANAAALRTIAADNVVSWNLDRSIGPVYREKRLFGRGRLGIAIDDHTAFLLDVPFLPGIPGLSYQPRASIGLLTVTSNKQRN